LAAFWLAIALFWIYINVLNLALDLEEVLASADSTYTTTLAHLAQKCHLYAVVRLQ
jgi:hypothetical protein